MKQKLLGPDHPDVAMTLNNLGALYKAQINYPAAERAYRQALLIFEKALAHTDHKLLACRDNLNRLQVL